MEKNQPRRRNRKTSELGKRTIILPGPKKKFAVALTRTMPKGGRK